MRSWRVCAGSPADPAGWDQLRQRLEALSLADHAADVARVTLLGDLARLVDSGNHLCPVDRSYFHQSLFRLLWRRQAHSIQP